MSIQTKTGSAKEAEIGNQLVLGKPGSGRFGLRLVALACGGLFSLSAMAANESSDLTPMITEEAEKALQFGDKKDLAVVIAIDEDGNHKIYRGRKAESDGKEVPFPIDADGISSMDSFTIFKTNPWYIYVNGVLVCI